jgi:plasmid replication initiation protein
MKTSILVKKIELDEIWEINVCSTAKYNKKEGRITVKFTDDIMPYLAQVRQKFVLYNLKEIANFGSLYTTRLYELIQEFKDTGCMIKSINQLREAFAVGNNFKLYSDFKRRTFEHACQEINDNYQMNLEFEEIKESRKVVAIKFFFKKTVIHKVINQKTGIEKNFYEKPAPQTKNKKAKTINSDVLEGQLAFTDLKNEAKPISNILSKIFKKLVP